jgi:hypothetical protein
LSRQVYSPSGLTSSKKKKEEPSHPEGILPVTKSKRDFVLPSDWRYRFLVGNGESLEGCGRWMWRGCLEHKDVDVAKAYNASCGRLACPVCYEKACGKKAVRIEHRVLSFGLKNRNLRPTHVAVSPSELDVQTLSFNALRRRAEEIAMACGVLGGCIVFHPFRRYNEDDFVEDIQQGFDWKEAPACWYVSAHFHIIGYGWIRGTKENFEATGWIVKNLRVRKSVRSTAHYILSHCGINDRFHTVVWFGVLSYNKLKVGKLPDQEHLCPFCGQDMKKIEFVDPEYGRRVESSLESECIRAYPKGTFRYVELLGRLGDGGG